MRDKYNKRGETKEVKTRNIFLSITSIYTRGICVPCECTFVMSPISPLSLFTIATHTTILDELLLLLFFQQIL